MKTVAALLILLSLSGCVGIAPLLGSAALGSFTLPAAERIEGKILDLVFGPVCPTPPPT